MSCNGGSHPRINTLGRMTRAESGPDLRYEMTSGGGGTSRIYYSRRGVITDQNSDGYWWVPARRARAAGRAGDSSPEGGKVFCSGSRKSFPAALGAGPGCPDACRDRLALSCERGLGPTFLPSREPGRVVRGGVGPARGCPLPAELGCSRLCPSPRMGGQGRWACDHKTQPLQP